jgi:hypothetical protein
VAVVMEGYVNRVSTRKVDRLVEQLGSCCLTEQRTMAVIVVRPEAGSLPGPMLYSEVRCAA